MVFVMSMLWLPSNQFSHDFFISGTVTCKLDSPPFDCFWIFGVPMYNSLFVTCYVQEMSYVLYVVVVCSVHPYIILKQVRCPNIRFVIIFS